MPRCDRKFVSIAGAAKGIGRAVALPFVREGVWVAAPMTATDCAPAAVGLLDRQRTGKLTLHPVAEKTAFNASDFHSADSRLAIA